MTTRAAEMQQTHKYINPTLHIYFSILIYIVSKDKKSLYDLCLFLNFFKYNLDISNIKFAKIVKQAYLVCNGTKLHNIQYISYGLIRVKNSQLCFLES